MKENYAVKVRGEQAGDYQAISEVNRLAFADQEHSQHNEHLIVIALRESGAMSLSLVADVAGTVVGCVAFSQVVLSDATLGWFGLGPLAVLPEWQNKGIGSQLVKQGLSHLKSTAAKGCVVLGDPSYYTKFGFRPDERLTLAGVAPEYFLALSLNGEIPQAELSYHDAFYVSA